MKNRCKFLIFFGLLWASTVWAAEWISVGLYDAGSYYVDRASMTRLGQVRKVWTMLDYRQPQTNAQGKTYLSTRTLMEFDCKRERVRPRSLSLHSGNRLQGQTLTS